MNVPCAAQRRGLVRHRGFTLLEVLLAMALGTALLAALWSAMSIHLRAFDSGRMEIERTQVARALLRKLESDLKRTLPERAPIGGQQDDEPDQAPLPFGLASASLGNDATTAAPPTPLPTDSFTPDANSFSAPSADSAATGIDAATADPLTGGIGELSFIKDQSASLIGNAFQLRLRICQPEIGSEMSLPADDFTGRAIRLPDDLKSVYYWLARDLANAAFAGPLQRGAGLVRREGPWLRWRDPMSTASQGAIQQPTAQYGEEWLLKFYRRELPDPAEKPRFDPPIIAEEIWGLRFRYSDGVHWHNAWNSAERGRLPAAVEVALFVDTDQPADKPEREANQPVAGNPSQPIRPDYRMLVVLTGGERFYRGMPGATQMEPNDDWLLGPMQ